MPRPGRAYWKGHLRLSLVSIPVEIYNAVESASEISFNQIHKPSGKRVNYLKVVKGVGEVDSKDIVKGYPVGDDTYVLLEPDEIDAIRVESKKTIELVQFVDASEIDPRYFERPYYLVPADEQAAEGYLVIREALASMGKVGLGQVTISGREHLVAVAPVGKGMVLELIRYANELRPPEPYFQDVPELKLDKEMVEIATQIIDRKSGKFDPGAFSDSYQVALKELVARKAAGQKIRAPAAAAQPAAQVIDLMSALKRSLEGGKGKAKAPAPAAAPSSKRRPLPTSSRSRRARA